MKLPLNKEKQCPSPLNRHSKICDEQREDMKEINLAANFFILLNILLMEVEKIINSRIKRREYNTTDTEL